MNRAEEKFDEIKRFLATKLNERMTHEFCYAVRAMCVTELDERDHEEALGELLADQYGETVMIAGCEYSVGDALKAVDRDVYDSKLNRFLREFTMNCGFYYFYEDQLEEMLAFLKSLSFDALYETLYPHEVAS